MPLEPDPPHPDRADPGTRLTAGCLAVFAVGFGLWGVIYPPPECWRLARVSGAFFVAVGCTLLVVAVVGRRSALKGVSPGEVAADAAGNCLGQLLVLLLIGLVGCVVRWAR